ncbi:hypothetical protein EOA13_21290 [Mesorhizobium sp. M7A.F.Ca.US.011.01.1.1]|uniref:hypothetical protein n=1 Tax=Mesorhizobium sp. M7A.F.Ca.US.011.01.1.1 TaxID=2496741 RepID=UPI000FC9BCC5|nr:hypothetical protein [Mesorhizobium sp. M7A.F.Ca.US.011.01.1.1]RUX27065.1 hypothetical protein EOA13_21290 [Mesorhizobium sp. M7A.F.Ca.US.011.01.1.1]
MEPERSIDLYQYLAKSRDLLVDIKVAQRLHIPRDALVEMVKEGLCPEPRPGLASNRYWFYQWQATNYKSWARTASDDDVRRAADIILKDDRTRRIREFEHYDNADPRKFLTTLFSRKAW